MTLSDVELLTKVKLKDKQGFTELVNRYGDRILGYLYRYVGDYQLAEDLVIETFMNAYNNIDTYEEMGMFSSWLYRIATNCAKKELRKKDRSKTVSMDAPIGDDMSTTFGELIADDRSRPDYTLREKELKEFVYLALSKLDEKYKDALLLCDVEGLSYEEAAKVLHSVPQTIGTRLRRARVMLHDILGKYGFND